VKYAHRYHVIKQALEGFISSSEGAKILVLSPRHFKRLKKKVRDLGPKALIHGNSGRTPPNAYPEKIKQKGEREKFCVRVKFGRYPREVDYA
jgi:hypothetical protein